MLEQVGAAGGSVVAGGLRGFLSAWSFDVVFIAKDACLQMRWMIPINLNMAGWKIYH